MKKNESGKSRTSSALSSFLPIALCLLCGIASAATNIYVGGSADGYDDGYSWPAMGYPYVDNAAGATGVTDTAAWLNGFLVSTGSAPTTVYVYWGDEDGVTNKTTGWDASTNFGVCTEWQSLTTNVTLSSGTTYYYRFYASNAAGEEAWAISSESFTTDGSPLVNSSLGAGPVSFTTATLSGNLTSGKSADIYIYCGQDTNSWSNTNSLGNRANGALFWSSVSGLSEGSLYYYRCYATNDYGGAWSDVVPFTTLVPFTVWAGGDADGYDELSELSTMMSSMDGTLFMIR